MENHNVSPFNALPPVVVALAAVIAGLEVLFQLATAGVLGGQGGIGWRLAAIQDYAVLDEVVDWMLANGRYPPDQLLRFLTYPLIHGGFVHAAFVVVFVLAIGKMVAEVFSPLAFVTVFWISAIVGALGYTLLLDSPYPLIGGYPGVYGLIGAFTFLMWVDASRRGDSRMRAFGLIGALLAIQLLFGVIQGDFGSVTADLSGFVAGFLLSFVVSPGGWRRALDRLRQR
ncbi:rhomboid family intramembrane serine protease [Roseibacterium sp. SDUM158017]|uniref:rhomboid family intramembrane serine protease n=1 Tax=Roseicyclus salinarum TaxID=3036773 RepID=UPI0024158759|nr:rhomboid family intramembrane serine protease [Roseibacterium sp. SDUM158017]MDG4647217.1 rhomboid family intramembrane serine protease [Roseibacterium sp. SDUM158017]